MNYFYLSKIIKYLNILLIFTITIIGLIECQVVDLTNDNFDDYISKHELVFVNFHAEWCQFSEILTPIYKEAANKVTQDFEGTNRVVFGRVNCDENPTLSARYKISKYPTLKFFLNGKPMKKEYRGQRTEEAIVSHVRKLLTDPVIRIDYKDDTNLSAIMYNKSAVIGYFKDSPEMIYTKYTIFRRVAADLRSFCEFYWITNSPFVPQFKEELLAFKSSKSTKQSEYDFIYQTYDELNTWSTILCIPIVREITFENAEEIIEEDLPLVILFHLPEDEESEKLFKEVIHRELIPETVNVNFVTADAKQFEHPLHHMNRTKEDLPIIAIDSFKHMYLFPDFKNINKTGVLVKFVKDLYSGKLHREFHFGPEDEEQREDTDGKGDTETVADGGSSGPDGAGSGSDGGSSGSDDDKSAEADTEETWTGMTDSVFKKLAPSEFRYTLLKKDEL